MLELGTRCPDVILVDDEPAELDAYSFLLRSMGIEKIHCLSDSSRVMALVENIPSPVVFLDLNMPGKSGQEVLRELKERWPQLPVIICTANSEIETAVECLKLGAHDYLVKPINMNSFGSALRNALAISELRAEVASLKGLPFPAQTYADHPVFGRILSASPAMAAIFNYLESIAASTQPVLILGETGTGKELLARAVHEVSGRGGEYVAIDVSGLDDTLFADTLFGHLKGAYTGASGGRSGLLEAAAGGTIFLDEIGDLSEASQVKLLRVLQEGIYYPLGADQPRRNNARIVVATNRDLTRLAGLEDGFRRDLYYRLSTHLVKIPPLRERREDIPLLARHLIAAAAGELGIETPQLGREALQLLMQYDFPGNVRELKSYLHDAVARSQGREISGAILRERLAAGAKVQLPAATTAASSLEGIFGAFPTLEELSEYAVEQALKAAAGNQSQAARLLGISKQALHKRLKKRQQESG